MDKKEFISKINNLTQKGIPYLFLIDFEMEKPIIIALSDIKKDEILYDIKGFSNCDYNNKSKKDFVLKTGIVDFQTYKKGFNNVIKNINAGNSYLLNLTYKTPIEISADFEYIFNHSKALYKLKTNSFVLFSPECFIKIADNKVYSYPMKGTINADIPDAKNKLLTDKKELWEHNTIVDLIRNDLSIIAKDVRVTKFRYIDILHTNKNTLLQCSSEITGDLPKDWKCRIGEILFDLLPAGSISGAPKAKTCQIIRDSELEPRGYFTGIFGVFDGKNLDSAVNIRFIEQKDGKHYFRSGGGITSHSKCEDEYNELIQKVYVPIRVES